MTKGKVCDEATKVTAKDGDLILDGPDAVDVKVTPEAGKKTADNLFHGARNAAGQRHMKGIHKRG